MFHSSDRVLVAIMNNRRDFEIARDNGWYRIPQKHAPRSTTEAAALAFYFTQAFGDEKWSIRWYGAVRGHELVRRRDLFPKEPDHPRANDPYYKLQLGPLMQLELAIHSLRWRRITFIETSWDRFTAAEEINDLYASGADGLYVTLKDEGFWPEREFELREGGVEYTVGLAIPCREGTVAIAVGDRPAPPAALREPNLEAVRRAVERLGGEQSVLTPPQEAEVL
ncbi:MAG: hypothetical protein SWK90_15005 [Chloroflexota bacterium]|nr:hypothetical protein [Chloroflexota bacterium]